jgi:hypothetical protein
MLKQSYKRFFAFGCSYTSYCWAMWPEIIKHELGDVEFYNMGRVGAGNSYIAHQIYLADIKYNFGPDDLIMVCWTHAYRIDWLLAEDQDWCLEGLMFYDGKINSQISDEAKSLENCEFRDCNIVVGATEFLNQLSSDTFTFTWIDNLSSDLDTLIPFRDLMKDIPLWNTDYYVAKRRQLWEQYIGQIPICDMHPMPIESLEFLSDTLEYAFSVDTVNSTFNYHKRISEVFKSQTDKHAWETALDLGKDAKFLVYFLD